MLHVLDAIKNRLENTNSLWLQHQFVVTMYNNYVNLLPFSFSLSTSSTK